MKQKMNPTNPVHIQLSRSDTGRMEQAPKTTMTFSFASPFSFARTSSSHVTAPGITCNCTTATTEQSPQFSYPSNFFKAANVFGSAKTQASFSGFDSLSSSNAGLSKGQTWPNTNLQNKQLFSASTTATPVFFGGKSTQSTWKLKPNFPSTMVQERKDPLSFSFTRAFHQDSSNSSNTQMQESAEARPSKNAGKESSKKSIELQALKHSSDADKLKHSSKQTGRLFDRTIAGVKTASKSTSSEPVTPTKVAQPKKDDKLSRLNSFTEDRRIASPEEIRQITSIICANIPAELNNKPLLLNHFSKFGSVKRVSCNLKKKYAVIHFHDHDSANNAKRNGLPIVPGHPPFEIYWTQQSSSKKSTGMSSSDREVAKELQYMTEGMGGNRSLFHPTGKSQQEQRKDNKQIQKQNRKPAISSDKSTLKVQVENSEEVLSAILSMAAQTSADRFRVLEARDKLLRLRQQKQSDITKAKAVKGCCPDMCPEKERYSRADKNCLSIFEMQTTGNGIDHSAVIKEYSRSSADQEEPLPHELRPPNVLIKTMDYLLCNIMDLAGFGIGEWYDFIWNRTRAIRKDITQQHLCSLESVALVEKCTRFHIHCSAVLCEEDMASFDSKINDENLTKCLQTLKHLYHDLDIEDVRCPHEAEFRAYDVLLNLNKGDIVREVQQFPSHIRESEELKFATSIFMALNSNNYVRFFRLVRHTTYLNACLLHRYFSEVRIKALHTILKAYCVPNRSEQFPLSELIQVLAFENVGDVQSFCDTLGLRSDGTFVILNRGNFVMPESSLPAPRAFQLIENKRTVSIGELINGFSLPENPKLSYHPHDSFDKEGNLKKEAYDASDQVVKYMAVQPVEVTSNVASQNTDNNKTLGRAPTAEKMVPLVESLQSSTNEHKVPHSQPMVIHSEPIVPYSQPTVLPPEPIVPHIESTLSQSELTAPHPSDFSTQVFSEETIKDIVEGLIEDVVNASVKENIEREILLGQASNEVFHYILENLCKTFISEIASEALSAEKEAKINLLKAKERERQLIEAHYAELIEETLAREAEYIARDIYHSEKMYWLETKTEQIWNNILHETLSSELIILANQVYTKEAELRKAALKKIQERRELSLTRKAFNRWKQFYVRRRHLDYARRTFPSAPPLIKKYRKLINQDKALKFVQALQSRGRITDAAVHHHMLEVSRMWQPLDITNVLWQPFIEKYPNCHSLLSFKLLLILPVDESEHSLLLKEWFAAKFRHKFTIRNDDQCNVERLGMYVSKAEDDHHMLVSINCIDKYIEESIKSDFIKNRSLMGTNAFMIVIPELANPQFQLCLKKERRRLEELLLCQPFYPPVALHIFISQYQATGKFFAKLKENIAEELQLSFLKNNNFICDWNISVLTNVYKSDADQQVLAAVKHLSEVIPAIPLLTSYYLKDFMEDQITKLVFNAVFDSLSEYHYQGINHHQHPRIIINLHNAAIEHMISIASSNFIEQFSWPLPEVFEVSTDKDYPSLHWNSPNTLKRIENKMRSVFLPKFPESFDAECESDIWKYIALLSSYSEKESVVLKSEISHLIGRFRNTEDKSLPWDVILQACSFFILDTTDFFNEEENEEWKIHYFEEDLECFQPPEEWITATCEQFSISGNSPLKCKIPDEEYTVPVKKPKLSLESASATSVSFLIPNDIEEKMHQLSAEIEAERQSSKSFMQLLEKLLEEGDMINNNFSTVGDEPVNMSATNYENSYCLKEEDLETKIRTLIVDLKSEQTASKLHTMKLNLAYEDEMMEEIFGSSIFKNIM